MTLTVLGSGTMMPTRKRFPAGYLVDTGSTRVLLDCGAPTLARLVDQGVPFREIEALCLSHFHTDHFAGLFPFIHGLWVDNRMTGRQDSPVLCIGPEGMEDCWKKLKEVYWPEPQESFPLQFRQGSGETTLGHLTIQTFPVRHVPWFPSVGFRITAEGKTLVYTGDVGSDHPLEDLMERVKGAHILLIEAAATKLSPNHFTIEQVLKLQEASGVRRVIVTHVRDQQLPALKAKLAGARGITIAEDGQRFECV